jgi:adenylate cyclase
MEQSRPYFFALWTSFPVELLLMLSFICHSVLALRSLYLRNTLKMSMQDKVQLVSSLLIIPLLIPHIFAIKAGQALFSIEPTFTGFLTIMWVDLPLEGLRQVLLLIVVWIHGCIGLLTWLKLKVWWGSASPFIHPLAVAIPTLALLGFAAAGREAVHIYENKPTANSYQISSVKSYDYQQTPSIKNSSANAYQISKSNSEFKSKMQLVDQNKRIAIYIYLLIISIVFIARYVRLRGRKQWVNIKYADGETATAQAGATLLEISISNDIPHANLCHGKGRCGTCRVKIIQSSSNINQADKLEQIMLDKLNCPEGTRLACQVIPQAGEIHIERLFRADIQPENLRTETTSNESRNSTPISEENTVANEVSKL